MSRTLRRLSRYDAAPEELLAAVTAPDFLQARVKPGTSAGAAVREVSRDPARLVQELHSEDYARTRTGGIDRERIEPSVTTYEWDLPGRRCSWVWKGAQDSRVGLRGRIAIRPAGTGSELETEFEIDVRLPLLGGVIERIIAADIEGDLPRFEGLLRESLSRR